VSSSAWPQPTPSVEFSLSPHDEFLEGLPCRNQGRLLEYSRVVPVYSGPAYGAASHVHTEVVVNCVVSTAQRSARLRSSAREKST
jgi:hypothetical protein